MSDRTATSPLPLVLVALLGGLVGGTAVWFGRAPSEIEVEVPRDLNDDELAVACMPLTRENVETLEQATTKVAQLEAKVTEKEDEIRQLEVEMARRASKGRQLVRELNTARSQLKILETELDLALEEKAQIQAELEATQEELAVTRSRLTAQAEATRVAKEDALEQRWSAFVKDAQLEVCERGNRKKLGRCREGIEMAMTADLRARFKHCIRSGQAYPEVTELERAADLPEFATYIDQENRVTNGWFIQFCDPMLPEALPETPDDISFGTPLPELDGSSFVDELPDAALDKAFEELPEDASR